MAVPQRYARARDLGCHAQFEQLGDIIAKVLAEEFQDPQNARIAIDAIKWRLSKMLPAVYGERSHLEVSGGVKVETIKDMAPEWMREELARDAAQRLAGGEVEVIEDARDASLDLTTRLGEVEDLPRN